MYSLFVPAAVHANINSSSIKTLLGVSLEVQDIYYFVVNSMISEVLYKVIDKLGQHKLKFKRGLVCRSKPDFQFSVNTN